MMNKLVWEFPLPRTHTGILLGNARLGAMVWGENATLRITLGRADLWDHRGGMPWTDRQNYADIRRCLEAGDESGIRELFRTETESVTGQPARPSVIPVGRIEIGLGEGALLRCGELDLSRGEVTIEYERKGEKRSLKINLSMTEDLLWVEDSAADTFAVTPLPAWDTLGDTFKNISFPEPKRLSGQKEVSGWFQNLPVDPGLAVLYKKTKGALFLSTARGGDEDSAISAGSTQLNQAVKSGTRKLAGENHSWWKSFWADVPEITLPNQKLEAIHAYGMYKFAGFSAPSGVAGTLQGPWIEEYQMPPWSSDYHFNINVQMCYWPAFKGNRLSHLTPLFDLIFSWEEKLRENARAFLGVEDGIMLPHAVDDRSTCMGGFWTGCIDHACTAWVAQMMYDYAMYSGDWKFLRERAYPFMKGTMRVYEAMLERDGDRFRLPVSVSPEYRGSQMNAWGANASFQLACIHRLIENLQAAAGRIGAAPEALWQAIADGLPRACLIGPEASPMIALWEGTNLEESHRHHSHLAGLCPFDTLVLEDPKWRDTILRSVNKWVGEGMGLWSGWCVPWASMLHSRLNNGAMAELMLTIWERVFTNEGRGTLHDCNFPGFSLMGASWERGHANEIMQLDAGFGAVVAIQDMLMHTRRGVHYIFAGVPYDWKSCSFAGMLTEGAFLLSASRQGGRTSQIEVKAQLKGGIRLSNPWPGEVKVSSTLTGVKVIEGKILDLHLDKGERCTLTPQ